MRLIDADELRKNVLKWMPSDPCGKEEKEFPFETDICASMVMEIDDAPTVQPDTTTHDSIPAETGKNDGDRTSGDCISRQRSVDTLRKMQTYKLYAGDDMILIDQTEAQTELMMLPPAQPETNCSEIPNNSDAISRQLLGTNLAEVGTDCISRQQVIEPESISRWKKEFKEYVDSLDIAREDWKGIIEYIDELPLVQPDTTTHDSIPAEIGKNDADKTSGDFISKQASIDELHGKDPSQIWDTADIEVWLNTLPSAQSERKTGRWIQIYAWSNVCKCSECGRRRIMSSFDKYCSYCGAKMDGGEQK